MDFHLLRIAYEVWREISSVKLHTFDNIEFIFYTFCLFDSDNTVFTDFIHRFSDQIADLCVGVCRNTCNLCDLFFIFDHFCVGFQLSDDSFDCFVHTAFYFDRVCTCRDVSETLFKDCRCQYSCCCCTVTRFISSV